MSMRILKKCKTEKDKAIFVEKIKKSGNETPFPPLLVIFCLWTIFPMYI